jgi:phosphate transport system substrate-binding protein
MGFSRFHILRIIQKFAVDFILPLSSLAPHDLQVKKMTDCSQSEKYPPPPLTGGEGVKSPLACQGEGVGGEVLKAANKQLFNGLSQFVLLSLLCFLISSCNRENDQNNPLTITSSTQFISVAESLGNDFRMNRKIPVQVKGTLGQEQELLKKDLTDLLISTEDLSSESFGLSLQKKIIANDQTLIITNPANPIHQLTTEQIKNIFTGKITNWSKISGLPHSRGLGGTKPSFSQNIQIITRESGPLRVSFESQFLNNTKDDKEPLSISLNALVVNSNAEIKSAVSSIPGAIGYMSAGSLDNSVNKLQIFNSQDNSEFSFPLTTIWAYWRTDNIKQNQIHEFMNYLNDSPDAKNIIQSEGLIIPEAQTDL